jgi:nitroreductase
MKVPEAIKQRRSIRAYSSREVSAKKLARVLEAARLAPSACNRQPWKFVVVREEQTREKLARLARNPFVTEAPITLAAVCTEPEWMLSSGVHAYAVDLAIAIDHITLMAVHEGLGTCWIGDFDQEEAKSVLEVPEELVIVALLPLGYPAEEPAARGRKELEEIVCYEKYCNRRES